jgi:hypothetical protein
MIPGVNVLNMAFNVIAQQTIAYYKYLSRSLNNVGQDVSVYDTPVNIKGSFQPIPRSMYQSYGLDLQKDYWMFYVSKHLIDVYRDVSGDQIAFKGQRFQCESSNDWFDEDGWVGVLCVLITAPTDQPVFGFGTIPAINAYTNYANGNFKDA